MNISVNELVHLLNTFDSEVANDTEREVARACKAVLKALQNNATEKEINRVLDPLRKVANLPHTFAINPGRPGKLIRDWETYFDKTRDYVAYTPLLDVFILHFIDYLIFKYTDEPIKICIWDEKAFKMDPRAPHQIYCSDACSQAAYRSRKS
jgi:hypothetical protein